MDSADFHRPHRTSSINSSSSATVTTAPSDLFICFTSRFSSSSSMKLSSSKSILSPARARDAPPPAQISLSSSLSRRLRSNGSLKGGQASPMFHSGTKKRGGGGFENPEPSSPKVTCIGQVRVRSKKQGKKLRTRSKRREVSFRKLELSRSGHHSFPPQQSLNGKPECLPHRNQRWVHFPVTICEALRTLGADWNCFLPCRSSCMSSREEKAVTMAARSNGGEGNGGMSCDEVVDRWLVAVHEGGGMERRDVGLVVGGQEIIEETEERSGSRRRNVFEGIEFSEEEICRERKVAEEEEQGRVSICIPPKNALLLMRCRSDPVKMAALAKRFCGGSPVQKEEEEEEEEDCEDCQYINGNEKVEEEEEEEEEEVEIEEIKDSKEEVSEECQVTAEASEEQGTVEAESSSMVEEEEGKEEEEQEEDREIMAMPLDESVDKPENKKEGEIAEIVSGSGDESPLAREDEDSTGEEDGEAGAARTELLSENNNDRVDLDDELVSTPLKLEPEVEEAEEGDAETIIAEKALPETDGRTITQEMACECERGSEPEKPGSGDSSPAVESKGRDSVDQEPTGLPDCLLLMMREPKLSMEVSKETWVCSTDFIRRLPERHVKKAAASGNDPKKRAALNTKRSGSALTAQQARILQQPPRSSCSFPSQAAATAAGAAGRGGESVAAMVEQKLLSAKPGEPFVLTRCKSEPMRTEIKLTPDACFWKNRKLEPHRQSANLRVKAAGMGF